MAYGNGAVFEDGDSSHEGFFDAVGHLRAVVEHRALAALRDELLFMQRLRLVQSLYEHKVGVASGFDPALRAVDTKQRSGVLGRVAGDLLIGESAVGCRVQQKAQAQLKAGKSVEAMPSPLRVFSS